MARLLLYYLARDTPSCLVVLADSPGTILGLLLLQLQLQSWPLPGCSDQRWLLTTFVPPTTMEMKNQNRSLETQNHMVLLQTQPAPCSILPFACEMLEYHLFAEEVSA